MATITHSIQIPKINLPENYKDNDDDYGDDDSEFATIEVDALADKNSSTTFEQFMLKHQSSIISQIKNNYMPKYRPDTDNQPLPAGLLRKPIGGQEITLRAAVKSLKINGNGTIAGEMGTGKTLLAIIAAVMAGKKRILVLCPPHLVEKWKREVNMTFSPTAAWAVTPQSITDLNRIKAEYADYPAALFVIISREKAKLSYGWQHTVNDQIIKRGGALNPPKHGRNFTLNKDADPASTREPDGSYNIRRLQANIKRAAVCPDCGGQQIDSDGMTISPKDIVKTGKKLYCTAEIVKDLITKETKVCGAALWQAVRPPGSKKARIGLTDYIHKKMRHFFDLMVADEVHEYKAKDSAQGDAAHKGAVAAGAVLTLTGTLMGGYSQSLFYLLQRFQKNFAKKFEYNRLSKWIKQYGFYKYSTPKDDDNDLVSDGRSSARKQRKTTQSEIPGIMPGALFHIIGDTAFLRLNEVSDDLPDYQEKIVIIEMGTTEDPDSGFSQASGYDLLYNEVRAAMVQALAMGSKRLMGTYVNSLLSYADGVTRGETVIDNQSGELICHLPPMSEKIIQPKEQMLINIAKSNIMQGRRTLVYVNNTDTRDIRPRLRRLLQQNGLRAEMLDASVASGKREEKIQQMHQRGLDVLICNPNLVKTGLDLIEFPEIIWYQTDYSVYTIRQASRRSWRIGQSEDVQVTFLVYENTLQQQALALMAKKVQASLAVEGEIPEAGLSDYGETTHDMTMALAKEIAGQIKEKAPSAKDIEQIFKSKQLEDKAESRTLNEWTVPTLGVTAESVTPVQRFDQLTDEIRRHLRIMNNNLRNKLNLPEDILKNLETEKVGVTAKPKPAPPPPKTAVVGAFASHDQEVTWEQEVPSDAIFAQLNYEALISTITTSSSTESKRSKTPTKASKPRKSKDQQKPGALFDLDAFKA